VPRDSPADRAIEPSSAGNAATAVSEGALSQMVRGDRLRKSAMTGLEGAL
jgi:hypothetical protein